MTVSITMTLIAVLIALGLMAMAFWQKMVWLCVGAGGVWIVLAVFAMTENANTTIEWALGWIYFGVGFICLSSIFWLREKKDPEEEEDLDDKDLQDYKQHMKDIRGRGRQE